MSKYLDYCDTVKEKKNSFSDISRKCILPNMILNGPFIFYHFVKSIIFETGYEFHETCHSVSFHEKTILI